MGEEDGLGALEVRVAGHDVVAVGFGLGEECFDPVEEAAGGRVDGVADEEAHVGGDLFVARAAGVELEGEGADLFGELELDEVVDVFGLRRGGDDGGADLGVGCLVVDLAAGGGDAVRPVEEAFADARRGRASMVSSSSAVRMPAAARARACACEAATSWGSRRQSKGKLRCHCSKVRSRGSRKRPDHILVGCCVLDIFVCVVLIKLVV